MPRNDLNSVAMLREALERENFACSLTGTSYEDIKNDGASLWIFTVEFYETETRKCRAREFQNELKASDPDDFAAVIAGLANCAMANITGSRYPKRSAMGCLNCATSASLIPGT